MLLLVGLAGSQFLPLLFGSAYSGFGDAVRLLTMTGLAFIMVRVGFEFHIDKSNLRQYGLDYGVAFTAAFFPWVLVALYFVFALLPADTWSMLDTWKEVLLAGRFASPTSAGVLFSMLAAAGLGSSWLFRKARTLAIFDDLDTVLLMIPLKMLMVGLAWQLGAVVFVMALALVIAYVFLHRVRIPVTWPWVLGYAVIITAISEAIYIASKVVDESVPIHIEVLLPAFVLGCIMAYPADHGFLESRSETRATSWVAAVFMVCVGLSMPLLVAADSSKETLANHAVEETQLLDESLHGAGSPDAEMAAESIGEHAAIGRITASQPPMPWGMVALHVLAVTFLANLGKMFVALCYRKEAHWRERLALAIGMWPRGEVGAGVLVISLSYGIGGPVLTIALLSLAVNLLLTGGFIWSIRRITAPLPGYGNVH